MNASKNLGIRQNVIFRVLDAKTHEIVQEHVGHNSATNSLLFGIAHHLIGDFFPDQTHGLNPGYPLLSNYVPRYISLGTMGLINQKQDASGLPAGIGDTIPNIDDPEYQALYQTYLSAKRALDAAKEALDDRCCHSDCETCSRCSECAESMRQAKEAYDAAKEAYDEAYDALMGHNEEVRFKEYMSHRPGYGADGYDENENNNRKYLGLGYAYSSYDNTSQYFSGDIVTYQGYVYECTEDTPYPSGMFSASNWNKLSDAEQPSKGECINIELISPSFPRNDISYRDIVPEYESELPKTIDVVFSSMISTGALAQFRPEGQDYIFITEAGLWSKRNWEDSGENGLLAGYRIGPPNETEWDMSVPENREKLKRQILKVGKNQVVQVIWKIQIGSIDEFTDMADIRMEHFGYR